MEKISAATYNTESEVSEEYFTQEYVTVKLVGLFFQVFYPNVAYVALHVLFVLLSD